MASRPINGGWSSSVQQNRTHGSASASALIERARLRPTNAIETVAGTFGASIMCAHVNLSRNVKSDAQTHCARLTIIMIIVMRHAVQCVCVCVC